MKDVREDINLSLKALAETKFRKLTLNYSSSEMET